MKLPTQKKILKEDLKDAPSYVDGIINPVNSFMESAYAALNKNLTLTENIASFVKVLEYRTPSTYPTMDNVEFLNQLKSKPTGVMVMQAYNKDTYIPAAGPVYVPWVENAGSIIIHPITGLVASKIYVIRLVVF